MNIKQIFELWNISIENSINATGSNGKDMSFTGYDFLNAFIWEAVDQNSLYQSLNEVVHSFFHLIDICIAFARLCFWLYLANISAPLYCRKSFFPFVYIPFNRGFGFERKSENIA